MSFERKPVPDSPLPQYGAYSPPPQTQAMELANHEKPYASSPPPQAQPMEPAHYGRSHYSSPPPQTQPVELVHHDRLQASSPPPPHQAQVIELAHHEGPYASSPPPQARAMELVHHERPYVSSPPPQSQPTELTHHDRSYASSPPPSYVIQTHSGQYQAHPQMQQVQQTPPAHYAPQGGFSPQPNYYQQPGYFQPQAPAGGNTMSIASLTSSPAPVQCPACGQRATTATTHVPGNTTHAWALGTFCLTGCLCFIPYMMSSVKDVEHRCSRCGVHLATWHNSGRTDIKMHG